MVWGIDKELGIMVVLRRAGGVDLDTLRILIAYAVGDVVGILALAGIAGREADLLGAFAIAIDDLFPPG